MKVTPWEGRLPPGEEPKPLRGEPPLAQEVDTIADRRQVRIYNHLIKLQLT